MVSLVWRNEGQRALLDQGINEAGDQPRHVARLDYRSQAREPTQKRFLPEVQEEQFVSINQERRKAEPE